MPAPRGDEATPLMASSQPTSPVTVVQAQQPHPPPAPPITFERALEGRSILDDLGAEVVSMVWPVSICMAATVWLVRVLDPGGTSGTTVAWASAAYSENVRSFFFFFSPPMRFFFRALSPSASPSFFFLSHPTPPQPTDSAPTKMWGALANASLFVLGVAGITFGLAAAFKRGWTRAIYGYLAWSGFSLFFFLGGDLAAQLLAHFSLPVDALTFMFTLWNFAVGGVACLFVLPASPLTARQGYCIFTGVATAYIFCHVPPWTTWALLGAMAVYDLYAVLAPGGPLKALVELAAERGEDIPALIYEGRSTQRGRGGGRPARSPASGGDGMGEVEVQGRSRGSAQGLPLGVVGVGMMADRSRGGAGGGGGGAALLPGAPAGPPSTSSASPPPGGEDDAPATPASTATARAFPGLPDAIKLGLGDFIFYSVLVGRASMGDLIEAGAAYLGVIAGLGATLAALALRQHALPALPVSIALGMVCTAGARWVVEPVVMPLATAMLYF